MGINTLASKSDGNIISSNDVNQYKTAITDDLVPRNSAGAPTDVGGDLGTSTYRWDNAHANKVYIGAAASNNSIEDSSGDMIIKVNGTTVQTFSDTSNLTNGEPLGTVKTSILTVAQFQAIMGTGWVLMSGQSISGSDLHTLTSIATLPNMTSGFTPVQTDSDGNLTNTTTGQVIAHRHWMLTSFTGSLVSFGAAGQTQGIAVNDSSTYDLKYTTIGGINPDTGGTSNTGGTNNLAAGIKLNFFIKINN